MSSQNRLLARRVASLYGNTFLSRYVYWKIVVDPVYGAVAERLDGNGRHLIDLGCGVGVLPFYLRESGVGSSITGLDFDQKKIDRARRISDGRYEGLIFESKAVEELQDVSGDIVLLDILHYLDTDLQDRLLRSISERMTEGARVIVRDTLADGGWRARVTWLGEAISRASGWMRTTRINFPTLQQIDACFPEDRFERHVRPLWGRTPFNNFLLEYRRREEQPELS